MASYLDSTIAFWGVGVLGEGEEVTSLWEKGRGTGSEAHIEEEASFTDPGP